MKAKLVSGRRYIIKEFADSPEREVQFVRSASDMRGWCIGYEVSYRAGLGVYPSRRVVFARSAVVREVKP